jgi:hypothetical protein
MDSFATPHEIRLAETRLTPIFGAEPKLLAEDLKNADSKIFCQEDMP